LKLKIPQVPFDESLEEWLDAWSKESTIQEFVSLPCFVLYFIWWVRNLSIFQSKYIPMEVVVDLISQMVINFKKDPKRKDSVLPRCQSCWKKPPGVFSMGLAKAIPLSVELGRFYI
jgi:hypothetical protein